MINITSLTCLCLIKHIFKDNSCLNILYSHTHTHTYTRTHTHTYIHIYIYIYIYSHLQDCYDYHTHIFECKALKVVQFLTYLGSTVSSNRKLDKEIKTCIGKSSSAFGSLNNRWGNIYEVSLRTKIDIHKTVEIIALLYGDKSWTLYGKYIVQLDSFYMHCLRQQYKISWQDKISNSVIVFKCRISDTE